MAKPLFSSADQVMLWQGLQRMIEQANEHLAALVKGFQGVELDENTRVLHDAYMDRITTCKKLQIKIPQLKNISGDHNSTDKSA